MHRRRITRAGRAVLVLLVAALLAAFLAPSPWGDIGSLLTGAIVLFVAMGSFVGGTRGGAAFRRTASEQERVELLRRMYRPRGRRY